MEKMENSSNPAYFNLTMFVDIGDYIYPTFILCLLVYAFIISANLVIILVVAREKSLHEPMYVFIMCLSINSLYGSTGFFSRFLRDILSETHLISRAACFTQIYVIYSYACYELTILGVMAYDRYVAVCQPLHYHNKMTSKMMCKLLSLAWIFPTFAVASCLHLSVRLPLCGNKIPKVFCSNWPIVKLSCIPTVINNIVGMFLTIIAIFLPLAFTLYTYARIFFICRGRSSEFKAKVIQNCLPHIITFSNYSFTMFCDITLSRIDLETVNPFLAVILSLEFVVIPPILDPVVYSLKLPEIRKVIFRILLSSQHNRQTKPQK